MFEAFESGAGDAAARKRTAASTLAAAGAYVLLGLGVFIIARRAAGDAAEKLVEVSFERVAVKPAPPPPPPPPPPKPKKVAVQKVAPPPMAAPPPPPPPSVPKEMPKEAAPEAAPSDAPAPAPLAEVGGAAHGVRGGTLGATGPAPEAVVPTGDEPVALSEDDEPAQLMEGLDLRPEYPEAARAAGKEGLVIIKFVIKRDGTVTNIKVLRGESPFAEAAIEKVKTLRFRPAMRGGVPIATPKILKIPFKLSVG